MGRRRLSRPGRAALVALIGLAASACGASHGAGAGAGAHACNGSTASCSLRLDEVVFPGTHNSFAASSEHGWYFANQTYPIPRQLQDGIRALLIDVHYGARDPATGRVRTDLRAEGSDRNKVAEQLPASALRVADRVAGGVGLGQLKGNPEPYLCHTLCELGAEPLGRELKAVASFLKDHPRQALVVIVEDYVPRSTIERAFDAAGLTSYAETLPAHSALPTLGQLIDSDRRLLVFAEENGGAPAWYMPAFEFIQDTPLGALHPGQLSCARYRGTSASPLLLINHWVPPFPPSPAVNAQIGRAAFLRARIARCTHARGIHGAIVAVDFYQRTAVVDVARELNEGAGDGRR
ncbi:MAG TPA: hypothetical protein VLZ06_05580 [Solirubrobacteraceae bacterium]|nr:hypothetical protein [Solirubrobacteraceae bacterium]